jgi:hypothetical protein
VIAPVAGNAEEMGQHGPADAAASCRLRGVHRLQLAVARVKPLQRADYEESSPPQRKLKNATAGSSRPSMSSAWTSSGGLCVLAKTRCRCSSARTSRALSRSKIRFGR